MQDVMQKLEKHIEESRKQDIVLARLETKMEYITSFIDSSVHKFASKWTEHFAKGLISLALITVFGAMLAGVVRAAEWILMN